MDITDIENMNLILEKKVKERTTELENSNKKLMELDIMKNDFI
jgi:hypothetical protein